METDGTAAIRFPERPGVTQASGQPSALPDYLPARMLNEFVYCPRLFFYEWVEKLFAHSADTVEGALRHQELDKREDALPPAGELAPDERIHARSVTLSSDGLGLIARLDLVEGEGGQVSPVDYKRGAPRDGDDGPEAWPADRVQACAQALLLREHGYQCSSATVYYSTTRQRVQVPLDEALLAETAAAIRSAWQVALAGRIPPPLVDSAKCPRCSLVGICLPDETRRAMLWMPAPDETPRQLALFDEIEEDRAATLPLDGTADPVEVRRLVPARDDLRPLYVAGYGLSIAKSGDVLQVRDRKGVVQEARLSEISQVNTFGSVTVTGGALQALCFAGKPVAHFSFGGWFSGLTQGLGLKNIFLRRDQFRRADDVAFCLRTSAGFVATKIRNQRVLLQRNHIEPPAAVLSRMKALAGEALRCGSLEELLGIEGQAARLYFEHFAGMLKTDEGERMTFAFIHRNRRPPRDPVNALLSLAYSLLVKELTIICHAVGFDPFLGFYHQPRFGRPALALDLMEGFRPLLADSAVLTAINAGMVDGSDVVRIGEAVALTARGRKALIRAFEQRLDQLVTHPLFGYRVSYRRVLETQTRLLARTVMGEIPNYPGFETR